MRRNGQSAFISFSFIRRIPPSNFDDFYIKLKSITSKLHNASASVVFIKKALFVDVIPKFSIVKGQFINETDSLTAQRKLMKSHLTKHVQDLYNLSIQYNDLKQLLYSNIGIVLGNTLLSHRDRFQNVLIYLLKQKIKRKENHVVQIILFP